MARTLTEDLLTELGEQVRELLPFAIFEHSGDGELVISTSIVDNGDGTYTEQER